VIDICPRRVHMTADASIVGSHNLIWVV
jgi:hypothetical protein